MCARINRPSEEPAAAAPRRQAIESCLRRLAPRAPNHDFAEVRDHALTSPGLKKAAPDKAAWLSLVAYLRHAYTDYEDMMNDGYGAEAARHFCREQINAVLADWGCPRTLSDGAEE